MRKRMPLAVKPDVGEGASGTQAAARKQAAQARRKRRTLLASVLDNLPLGVGVYDRRGNLLRSNQRLRDYTGLQHLPSCELPSLGMWRGYDADGHPVSPDGFPAARALHGESVTPGLDFLYLAQDAPARWVRISAVPLGRKGRVANDVILVVQDVDDLKRAAERLQAAGVLLASQSRFLEATLSSTPDFVYAFDRERRFVYANPSMLALFGLSSDQMLGKTFADLDYPPHLADVLNGHIDRIFEQGVTVEDEVFFQSPTGYSAYFSYLWGPVRATDGPVELVVGVSRDTSGRRAFEEALRDSVARLRAATDLVGLGVYSWNPTTGALQWDDRLRSMWGIASDAVVTTEIFEAGIHHDDLPRVRREIAACIDPAGDGRYNTEYRVIGRDDGVTRHIATSGRTTFEGGRAVGFIGAAIEVTAQRRAEAAIRASEAQFRSFAAHSRNLIWIADPGTDTIVYRSAAYERIWGLPVAQAATAISEWMKDVHPDDRQRVEHALATVKAGEVVQSEFRIIRPTDGAVRLLRDTSFPIPDAHGTVTRIGGITVDSTQEDVRQVYLVSGRTGEARRLETLVRDLGYRTRRFEGGSAFLDLAAVLAPGCVLVDLRKGREEGLSIPRELKARSVTLPTIALDAPGADVATAVSAMRAGAVDYLILGDEASLRAALASALAECHVGVRPATRDETAGARVTKLTPRERAVLVGLVNGGTNKTIGRKLGISPRTVEIHRAHVMNRLNASNLSELLQISLTAGILPSNNDDTGDRGPS